MKFLNGSIILTDRYPHVIKKRVYYYRRFIKRHILKPNERIEDAEKLRHLLNDYFPGICFVDNEKLVDKKWDIEKYFYKEQGKWILDITAMSKNENYARLFPKDISYWDESLARSKYGSVDVIRFFIYEQNEFFFNKIPCLSRIINFEVPEEFLEIPEKFLEEIDYYEGTYVKDLWDFSEVVAHKPPDIHKAFTNYARRQYNLLAFALEYNLYNDNDPLNSNIDHLIKEVYEFINKKVKELLKELYPEIKKWNKEKQNRLFEKQQEILENKPEEGTDVPREWEKFINQLKHEIIGIKKIKYDDSDLPYTKNNRKTINNLLEKLKEKEPLTRDELEITKSGTLYEKVDLLHNYKEKLSLKKETSIEQLFLKNIWSLDKKNNENEDKKPRNLYDTTRDEQYLNPEDMCIRPSRQQLPFVEFKKEFEKEFKNELGKKLNLFLKKLQDYFEKYPLPLYYDSDGFFKWNKHSIEKLFKIFCSLVDIPEDEEIREPFLVMFRRAFKNAIVNIKQSEKD